MRQRALFVLSLVAVTVGALAFRLPRMSQRPMHGDEANQALKTGALLQNGVYRYDPIDHHGPSLYYAALPIAWLRGQTAFAQMDEMTVRLVPVIFGVGLALLLLLVGDGLGRPAAVCAGVLTAISPAMVYYSRYYIQEMLLVFFTFAAIACGWRLVSSRRTRWAVLTGLSLGMMHATKETCVLAFAAMGAALAALYVWQWAAGERVRIRDVVSVRHMAIASVSALAVSVLFFSSFFTHWRGVVDSVWCYRNYLVRSEGANIHAGPWYTYLKMLFFTQDVAGPWWSEGLILGLAAVGLVRALWPRCAPFVRFVLFYSLVLTVLYAAVPYKTPWCLLSFLHGFILLAGVGAATLVRVVPTRPVKLLVALAIAAGATQLAWQAYRTTYVFHTDRRNPYVYAHTGADLLHMVEQVEEIAAVSPAGRDTPIKVIAPAADYWPLPWYLRRFSSVKYLVDVPEEPDAPMVIALASIDDALEAKLKGTYFPAQRGLRPNVLMILRIRWDLWEKFIATRAAAGPTP